jgi:GntR family transcriptional regulator / MocR family aminotransferase
VRLRADLFGRAVPQGTDDKGPAREPIPARQGRPISRAAGYLDPMDFHVSLIGRKNLGGEIYRQLRRAIVDGRLRPGDRLPPTRELARGLSVSRTTATVAYDRLAGEGFVRSRVGAGTFVSEQAARAPRKAKGHRFEGALRPRAVWDSMHLPAAVLPRPAQFDFRTGVPDGSLFPYETWRRLVARQLAHVPAGSGDTGPLYG